MNRRLLIIGAVACAAAIAAVAVWRSRSMHEKKPLTPEERLALLHDTNVAIGRLENGEYAEAAKFFEDLVDRLPDEPLGYRNLPIALAAPTYRGLIDPSESKREALVAAIESLERADGGSRDARELAGRLCFLLATQHGDDAARRLARSKLTAAAELTHRPGPLYELYLLEKADGAYLQLSSSAMAALMDAYRLEPQNAVLAWELLRVAVSKGEFDLAGDVGQKLMQSLAADDEAGAQTSRELGAFLLRSTPDADDVLKLANQATAGNAAYERDRDRLQPSLLSFIAREFSDDFYKDLPDDEKADPIQVSFTLKEDKDHAPLAVAVDDVNSDGHLAIVALYDDVGYTRIETTFTKGGVAIEPITVPGKYTLLKLADLDLDFGKNMEPPDLDLVLGGPSGIRILENRLEDGKRRWIDHTPDLKLPDLQGVRKLHVFDLDNDGMLDIAVRHDKDWFVLRNAKGWSFVDVTSRSSTVAPLKALLAEFDEATPARLVTDGRILASGFLDYDNDGLLDVWFWIDDAKRPLRLFHNDGGTYTETTGILPTLPRITSPPVVVDLDSDGGLDFVLTTRDGICYLMNQGANKNHWLDLRLRSTNMMFMAPGNTVICNFSGIGNTVELRAGRHVQRQLVRGGTVHFGLGQREQVDTLRSVWTNGAVQNMIRPEVDRLIIEKQRSR